ncbi:MAG: hypothetical protein FJY85_08240 [Deltaproteobacteria bacterium]|nr:hypothetical protein [Deltaproteobacteria bacterium]
MNEELEIWISECIKKGTFASKDDAVEFCVGATRAFCEEVRISQESIKKDEQDARERGTDVKFPLRFPLKWSADIDSMLRSQTVGEEKKYTVRFVPTLIARGADPPTRPAP